MGDVVRQVVDHVRRQRQRADRRHAQRVAVGRRLRGEVHADGQRAAGPVVDHDLLADGVAERSGEQARQRVGGAAGGLRHDEVDRPIRKVRQGRARDGAG